MNLGTFVQGCGGHRGMPFRSLFNIFCWRQHSWPIAPATETLDSPLCSLWGLVSGVLEPSIPAQHEILLMGIFFVFFSCPFFFPETSHHPDINLSRTTLQSKVLLTKSSFPSLLSQLSAMHDGLQALPVYSCSFPLYL